MRNIKLTLEYDGSRFFGFQRQTDKPTIQAALEKALSQLFNRPMKISAAAGRTDSGVHAKAQIVNFKYPLTPPPLKKQHAGLSLEKIQKGLNAFLPKEIAVKRIEEAPRNFHARYDACWKTYEYRILNSKIRSPLLNGRACQYPYRLDLARMKKAARLLVGRHNFKTFQAKGSSVKDSIRKIRRLKIERQGNLICFVIEADGFLYHMVRNIVGTLLEVGRGSQNLEDFKTCFKKKDRNLAGPTVPAHGLILVRVEYTRKVAKSGTF